MFIVTLMFVSEMCFIFAKYWLIHQCWKIPHFSKWRPPKPCGHTKWKINCFYKMDCSNQLVIIYAESWWSHLLVAKTLFLYVVLFVRKIHQCWTMCFCFLVQIQRTLNQVYVFIYLPVKWMNNINCANHLLFTNCSLGQQSFQIGLYQFVILLATFPPYHIFPVILFWINFIQSQ